MSASLFSRKALLDIFSVFKVGVFSFFQEFTQVSEVLMKYLGHLLKISQGGKF